MTSARAVALTHMHRLGLLAATALFVVTLSLVAIPSPAHAAQLTESQIQSILGLLSSFGVDQNTITNVSNILEGTTGSQQSTQTNSQSGNTQTSTAATTSSAGFSVTMRVKSIANANVRVSPSINAGIIGQFSGVTGTIVAGPQSSDGYVWWQVNFDNGTNGWTVEGNLQKVSDGHTVTHIDCVQGFVPQDGQCVPAMQPTNPPAVTVSPAAPSYLTATCNSDGSVAYSWPAVSGASSYELHTHEYGTGYTNIPTKITAVSAGKDISGATIVPSVVGHTLYGWVYASNSASPASPRGDSAYRESSPAAVSCQGPQVAQVCPAGTTGVYPNCSTTSTTAKATINAQSLMASSGSPTITGTATGLTTVTIKITNGATSYGSGSVTVAGGTWSYTATGVPSIANTYLVSVYDSTGATLLTTGNLSVTSAQAAASPAAPASLTATCSADNATIVYSWPLSDNASTYELHVHDVTAGTPTQTYPTPRTNYSVPVTAGHVIYAWIYANNSASPASPRGDGAYTATVPASMSCPMPQSNAGTSQLAAAASEFLVGYSDSFNDNLAAVITAPFNFFADIIHSTHPEQMASSTEDGHRPPMQKGEHARVQLTKEQVQNILQLLSSYGIDSDRIHAALRVLGATAPAASSSVPFKNSERPEPPRPPHAPASTTMPVAEPDSSAGSAGQFLNDYSDAFNANMAAVATAPFEVLTGVLGDIFYSAGVR